MEEIFRSAVVLVQARMGSSRLPGKVLKDLVGEPMLNRVVRRARRARCAAQVAVATTTDPGDDEVEIFCRQRGIPVFRGSVFDVLDRFYQAACYFGANTLVRLTADCPLIDPLLIDRTVQALQGDLAARPVEIRFSDERGTALSPGGLPAHLPPFDFAATRLPPPWRRTFPIGLDTEVCSFSALERAWREAVAPYEREHVMPYLYDQPGRFRVVVLDHTPNYGELRWTVDTPEDLESLRQVFTHFGGRDDFSWLEVVDLFNRHPEMKELNRQVSHKTMSDVDHRYSAEKG